LKKLDWYIIRVILKPFLSTLFILVGMIWLLQSIRLMDLVINKNMELLDFLAMSVVMIPGMLIVLFPLSFFSGVYSGLRKMVADSEMDAIFAAGISRTQLLKPLLFLTTIVIGLTYFISLYAMPAGRMAYQEIKQEVVNKADTLNIQAGTFNPMGKGVTIYVKEIENNQWLKNITVYDNSKKDVPVTWTAEEGVLKLDKHNKPNLFLINGTRQEVSDKQTSVLAFSTHQIDITRQIKPKTARVKKESERFLFELLETKHLTREKDFNKYKAEFYKRLLWPLAPLPLVFIPFFFIFKPIKRRFGIARPSLYSVVISVGFVSLQMLANSRIASGAYEFIPVATALPFVVTALFAGLLIRENYKN
jgi:lipopolysaccharide export system permease protein